MEQLHNELTASANCLAALHLYKRHENASRLPLPTRCMNVGSVYEIICVKIVYWLEHYVFSKGVVYILLIELWQYKLCENIRIEGLVAPQCVMLYTHFPSCSHTLVFSTQLQ